MGIMKHTIRTTLCLGLVALLAAAAPPQDVGLMEAARDGDAERVRSLLDRGAEVNLAQGDGMTPLHWAAERGHASVADLLISASADVEAKTRIGSYTPLHLASRGGHSGVVQRLLEAGADARAATTNRTTARTPMMRVGTPSIPDPPFLRLR